MNKKWTPKASTLAKLEAFRKENAKAYEALRNQVSCERCGRPLRDPESIKAGIGPECIKNEGAEA